MGRQVGGIRVSQGSHKQPWQSTVWLWAGLFCSLKSNLGLPALLELPNTTRIPCLDCLPSAWGLPVPWYGEFLAWLHLAKWKLERQKASLLHLNTFLHALLWQLSKLIWSHVPVVYLSFFSFLCSPPSLPLGPADRPRGWGRNVPSPAVWRNFTAQC